MKLSINIDSQNIESNDFDEIIKKSPYTLLYFYPKDNTPGCSIEAKDFSDLKEEFSKKWVQIIWVSKDSAKSHSNFIDKLCITFPLVSDLELELHKKFWAWWEKSMYWKKYEWTLRSTYLLNNKWEVIKEWLNVKAAWHAKAVLKEIDSLIK